MNLLKTDIFKYGLLLVLTVLVSISISYFLFNKKIAYVRTGEIISKYKGIINANKLFSEETRIIQSNVDTLKSRFENAKRLAEKSNNQKLWFEAGQSEKDYQNYSLKAQEDLRKREQELSSSLIGKINTFIQEYGKSKGYTLILGTTDDGSILYGNEGIDLTEVILIDLNKQYQVDSLSVK